MKKIILCISVLMLTACAATDTPKTYGLATPNQQEIETADYGLYPDNYKEIIISYMDRILFDPDSAKYEFLDGPEKGWYPGDLVNPPKFGYKVLTLINSKNKFGGYTGNQTHSFLIKDGKVIDHI